MESNKPTNNVMPDNSTVFTTIPLALAVALVALSGMETSGVLPPPEILALPSLVVTERVIAVSPNLLPKVPIVSPPPSEMVFAVTPLVSSHPPSSPPPRRLPAPPAVTGDATGGAAEDKRSLSSLLCATLSLFPLLDPPSHPVFLSAIVTLFFFFLNRFHLLGTSDFIRDSPPLLPSLFIEPFALPPHLG
jgi:hypothetical protein